MNKTLMDSGQRPIGQTTIRLLHTTDLHGHVLGFDYHADAPSEGSGLSRAATRIAAARLAPCDSFLFDTGDFLQGTPLSDEPGLLQAQAHPMIAAMNILGYDAVTLGNHDLDFGLEHLSEALRGARFPVVSCNLDLPRALFPQLERLIVIERAQADDMPPLKIGVTGCLPAETLAGPTLRDPRIRCTPMAPALRAAIDAMKAAGADVIVVLAHCGLGGLSGTGESIRNTIEPLGGIDAILGGHTHAIHPRGPQPELALGASDTLITLAGAWGQHIGQIDLPLRAERQHWRREGTAQARTVATSGAGEAPQILKSVAEAHARTRRRVSQKLGIASGPITSFFALIENNSGLQIIAKAFETEIAEVLVKQGMANDLPILGMAAPFKTGQRSGASHFTKIAQGPIAARDIDALYSFHDTLCALRVSGAELKDSLEMSASIFQQILPYSRDQPLIDPRFPGYRFDVIPNLSYEIDLSRPALFDLHRKIRPDGRGRICNLRYNGAPVSPEQQFVLALSSFRAHVAPFTPAMGRSEMLFDTNVLCRDLIARYISGRPALGGVPAASWSFKPIEGASAFFESAPEAQSPDTDKIERIGLTDDGFALMRLKLG